MWDENTLKQCMEEDLQRVFGERVFLLDLDTVNTKAGRPDVVLLNAERQLIIVEWEPELRLDNIKQALLEQAWKYTKQYYCDMHPDDVLKMHRRYRDKLFPGRPVPDLHKELGIGREVPLWDRSKPCIVVVGAWAVRKGVTEKARMLITEAYTRSQCKIPCEVWVYDIHGASTPNGNVVIQDSNRIPVFHASGEASSLPLGEGLRISNQHSSASLTSEFMAVMRLMEGHVSAELKPFLEEFHAKERWKKDLLKWSPWGTEKDICFEFSRMDSENLIKGPHCQLCIRRRRDLGKRLKEYLWQDLGSLAAELQCHGDDLASHGHTYPIKQHGVPDHSPEAVAEVFGRFCSVIYRRVDPIIRKALGDG